MSLPIVLVSGWSMPAAVLEPLAQELDGDGRVSVVQLPGLVSEPERTYDWKALLEYLELHLLETPAVLVGWSLGGTLATIYASQNPDKVAALVTLGSNPCFVRNDEWPDAMLGETFTSFYQGMQQEPENTIQQFSMLCSMGNSNRKEMILRLQAAAAEAELEPGVLLSLLKLLGTTDVRSQLADIRCPVVHCLGKDDALVPAAAAAVIEKSYPGHRVQLMNGGHSFFLDETSGALRQVVDLIVRLCNRK
ncbi:MAG: alpha/beta fold hydrolase [Endozoicomonas sp.]